VGGKLACVLLVDGSVRCWGTSPLGDGTTNSSYTKPVVVSGLQSVTAIDANDYHVLALRSDGTVSNWGSIETSQGKLTDAPTPVVISGLSSVTSIASGSYGRNAALLTNKTAVGWGSNFHGAIGDGTTTFRATPVAIALTNISAIAPGSGFSCAVQNGAAFCWGSNSIGQLGNGLTTNSMTPVQVLDLSFGVTTISASDSGEHVCAIQNGAVRCWGFNFQGQLGNGTPTGTPSTPVSAQVTAVGVSGATALALGSSHTCALASGVVKCWGANQLGELGIGTLQDTSTPQAVNLGGTVTAIDAGQDCTCAVRSNGSVWCWGSSGAFSNTAMVATPEAAPPW
jgi:alpha-tubulin suppressor-like RCC1 family protein